MNWKRLAKWTAGVVLTATTLVGCLWFLNRLIVWYMLRDLFR